MKTSTPRTKLNKILKSAIFEVKVKITDMRLSKKDQEESEKVLTMLFQRYLLAQLNK